MAREGGPVLFVCDGSCIEIDELHMEKYEKLIFILLKIVGKLIGMVLSS